MKTVLCIEDDADILVVVRAALSADDRYRVITCENPRFAVDHAITFKPDIILLDVMMPDQDGMATLQQLRGRRELDNTPVVFLTAKAHMEDAAQYMKLGVSGVIPKPFDPLNLGDEVQCHLEAFHGWA